MTEAAKKFVFDHEKAEQTIKNYGKVQVNPEQEEMIQQLSEILHEHIGLYQNMLRSFIFISISVWQKENHTFLEEIASADPKTRLEAILKLAENLKKLLRGLLKQPRQEDDLDKAINAGLIIYKEKWMHRD